MNVSLFEAASGMSANARLQEITAQNLAASQVPGFKRQNVSFEAIAAGLNPAPSTAGESRYLMPHAAVNTDFAQGGMRSTQVDTDLALDGKGFFAVQLPSGEVGYTRDGEFHRTPNGTLVSKQGYPLLGDNGPIQLDPSNPKLSISPNGDVNQSGEPHGKIRIVEFNNPALLTGTGGGLFTAQAPGLKSKESLDPGVRQGYLELANTNSVAEMTHLISSMRMFEMNQRVAQSQDERLGKTITELTGNI